MSYLNIKWTYLLNKWNKYLFSTYEVPNSILSEKWYKDYNKYRTLNTFTIYQVREEFTNVVYVNGVL